MIANRTNSPRGAAIAIDIGGTTTKIGIVCREGHVLASTCFNTQQAATTEAYIGQLIHQIKVLACQTTGHVVLECIGIGAPTANPYTGIIAAPVNIPSWPDGLAICSILEEMLGLPCQLTNDANLAVLGEGAFGGAIGLKHYMVITLGTGLGCGIVLNGKLLEGHMGMAGEFGHIIIEENGRLCHCGRRGCLETYVSATGLVNTYKAKLASQEATTPASGFMPEPTAKGIANAARQGDTLALNVFEQTGKILGIQLANAIACYNPEAVFLAGGLAKAGNLLLKPTRKAMNEYLMSSLKATKLNISTLSLDDLSLLGAATLAWKSLENGAMMMPETNGHQKSVT